MGDVLVAASAQVDQDEIVRGPAQGFLITHATAWALSSAGRIPSRRERLANASRAPSVRLHTIRDPVFR